MSIKRTILVAASVSVIASVGWAIADRRASVAEIDATIADLDAHVQRAKQDASLLGEGVLKALVESRMAIYETSLAMLRQKRASWVHRIALRYTVDGKAFSPDSDAVIQSITDELGKAESDIAKAEDEAQLYGEGLLKNLILLRRGFAQQLVAVLHLRLVAARFGIPYLGAPANDADGQQLPPGQVHPDDEVL